MLNQNLSVVKLSLMESQKSIIFKLNFLTGNKFVVGGGVRNESAVVTEIQLILFKNYHYFTVKFFITCTKKKSQLI